MKRYSPRPIDQAKTLPKLQVSPRDVEDNINKIVDVVLHDSSARRTFRFLSIDNDSGQIAAVDVGELRAQGKVGTSSPDRPNCKVSLNLSDIRSITQD